MDRKWLILPLAASAVAAPYFLAGDGFQSHVGTWLGGGGAAVGEAGADYSVVAARAPAPGEQAPSSALESVLRFDISPAWVTANWPRVSTAAGDGELAGMRVAVSTGPQVDDLAGSLTYYFDDQRQVQRLVFEGATGDPKRLVELVRQSFSLSRESSLGAGLYVFRWNGDPLSVLVIRPAAVIGPENRRAAYEIYLEVNRGRNYVWMSERGRTILEQERPPRMQGPPRFFR